MLDQTVESKRSEGDYVEFLLSGASATGEFHCAECGYGVTVHGVLPRCPMCSGKTWEPHAWTPFTRAARAQR